MRRLLAAAVCAGLWGVPLAVRADCDGTIRAASYSGATDRYPHGVLGDRFEWARLRLDFAVPRGCGDRRAVDVVLPESLVFEDTAPRLADLDSDGWPEVVVVESHQSRGARLAVWGLRDGAPFRIAETPFIGTRFRWLAPAGIADLDGDGRIEIAYVDRPHLAKVLRVWRFEDGTLVPVASLEGVSNHRIGERSITGGIRSCDAGPEIVAASADWSRVMAIRLEGGELTAREIGRFAGPVSVARAMDCATP